MIKIMITKKGADYNLDSVDWFTNSGLAGFLLASNNLSDVASTATAKINLGIPSITNQANNRVCTATAVTDILNGEANLTFDGSNLIVTGGVSVTGNLISNNYIGLIISDADATPKFDIVQAGIGDSSMLFTLTGVSSYVIGIDNSDGNKYKIHGGVELGVVDGDCGFTYNYNAGVPLVGIGENDPLYTLHVKGNFYLTGAYSNNLIFDGANRSIAPATTGIYSLTASGSSPATGNGGAINIVGGTSVDAVGGATYIEGGASGGATGGLVRIRGGIGAVTGGTVAIRGGTGATYGNVYIGESGIASNVQIGTCDTPGTFAMKGVLHIAGGTVVDTFPLLFLENEFDTNDTTAIFCWDATTYYSVGIDQSTSRTFKIYNGTALGATAANIGYSFFVSGGLPYVGIGKEAAATYTLDVTGDIRVTDDLFVNDDVTITGAAAVGETLLVTGLATFANDIALTHAPLATIDASGILTINATTGLPITAPYITLETTGLITLDSDVGIVTQVTVGDAKSPAYSNIKTLYYTIGLVGLGCDYSFASVADVVEQDILLGGGSIIPAFSRVIDVIIKCTAALVGGTMAIDVGISGAGAEYISASPCDSLNETYGITTGAQYTVAPSNAASPVFFCATPSANWNTLSLGKWAIYITYIDNSATA